MNILQKLKNELKVQVEAGGPSEETFYKKWDANQRKSYIDEHPNSKFAPKEDNRSIKTNPIKNPQKKDIKNSKSFNPLKKDLDTKTKEFVNKFNSNPEFQETLQKEIKSWQPSRALYKAVPEDLIHRLETNKSQWHNDAAAFANGYINVDEYINKSGSNVSEADKKKLEAAQFAILQAKLGKNFKENSKKIKTSVTPELGSKFESLPVSLQGKIASIYDSPNFNESKSKKKVEQAINVASEMNELRKSNPNSKFAYDRDWMEVKPEGFSDNVTIALNTQQENPLKTTPNLGSTSVKDFFNKLSRLKKDPRFEKLPFSDSDKAETLDRYDRLTKKFNVPKENLSIKKGKMDTPIFSYKNSDGKVKRFIADSSNPNKFLRYPSNSKIENLNEFLNS